MRDVLRTVEAVAAAGARRGDDATGTRSSATASTRFAADLAAAGGAGAITPDLIPDEAGEWIAAARRARPRPGLPGRAVVDRRPARARPPRPAAASSTPPSTMGVTGARATVGRRAPSAGRAAPARSHRTCRSCVGLGVSQRRAGRRGRRVRRRGHRRLGLRARAAASGRRRRRRPGRCPQDLAAGRAARDPRLASPAPPRASGSSARCRSGRTRSASSPASSPPS